MGLDEALTELEDVDPQEFAETLKENSSPHYKAIYSSGFGAGKSSVKDELEDAETQLENLKGEREKLQERIEDLQGEQPEVGELRGKYESKLEDLQGQLQQKGEEIQAIREENAQTLRQKEARFFQERAKNEVLPHVKDADIADIKIQKALQDGRVQFDDDLNPKVYEPDGEVPTPIPDGKEPHEVFAKNLLDDMSDNLLKDNRPGSTGLGNASANGRSGVTISRDDARDAKKYRHAKRQAEEQGTEVTIVD